jgi:hypothetical protein
MQALPRRAGMFSGDWEGGEREGEGRREGEKRERERIKLITLSIQPSYYYRIVGNFRGI